jgi:hypothetical protein
MVTREYVLKLQFDRDQVSPDKLREDTFKVLASRLGSARIEVGTAKNGHPLLSITGPLSDINACHIEVTRVYFEKLKWHHFHLVDEAGDELRGTAYPILAAVEQEFRAFINQCLVETEGFSWWTALGEVELGRLASRDSLVHGSAHPLELLTFEELIDIVTKEVLVWSEEGPLSSRELIELIASAATLDDLKSTLSRRVQKFSFWNNVFARYFDDIKRWSEAEKELKAVIDLRNKVMHHRPIHLGDLEALQKRQSKLVTLITSAKSQLTEQEKVDIQTATKSLRQTYSALVREAVAESPEDALWRDIYGLTTAEGLKGLVKRIDAAADAGNITLKQALRLDVDVFSRMQEITKDSPSDAKQHILNGLLPKCLMDAPEADLELQLLRESLASWLDQYPESSKLMLRSEVLSALHLALGSANPRAACYTVS